VDTRAEEEMVIILGQSFGAPGLTTAPFIPSLPLTRLNSCIAAYSSAVSRLGGQPATAQPERALRCRRYFQLTWASSSATAQTQPRIEANTPTIVTPMHLAVQPQWTQSCIAPFSIETAHPVS
jgi:hypothetical protein